MKIHYEPQISRGEDGFYLTITLSRDNSYWTSQPARLEASNWDQAEQETYRQVAALARALGNGQ